MSPIRVLQMPDWRDGNPYQNLLAEALVPHGVETLFAAGRRRALPLRRAVSAAAPQLLHLHWPEAYLDQPGTPGDIARLLRLPLDLKLTGRRVPIVMTAHNLVPHDRQESALARGVYRSLYNRADRVIAHTQSAKEALIEYYGLAEAKVDVIVHGDLLEALPDLPARAEARKVLGIGEEEKICLIFGAIMGYKGIARFIEMWNELSPDARLHIVGKPLQEHTMEEIRQLAAGRPEITLEEKFLTDEELVTYLAAADLAAFNYRKIFASGAATVARGVGLPILMTDRATTVDLGEPEPSVIRFADDSASLGSALKQALAAGSDRSRGEAWRAATGWPVVAEQTANTYRRAAEQN